MPLDIKGLLTQLDAQRRKVDVDHFDITVRELVRMAADGELLRAPAYQRRFRWGTETQSRLIESIFLGLPVPSLFVAANQNGTWELVDGLQRISTLMHYVAQPESILKDINADAPLRLEGLRKIDQFNDLEFADLPTPQQLAFLKRALRVTVLSDKSDKDVRFEMFERLNAGGIALTAQEVRACIYRGPAADFLRKLANNATYQSLVKLQKGRKDDGTYDEVVLKFFAYLHDRKEFDGKVTQFLNRYMEEHLPLLDLAQAESLFMNVVSSLAVIVDGPVLRAKYSLTPINQLEAIMVAAGELFLAGKKPKAPKGDWLNDAELVAASTKGTNVPSALERRISRAKALLSGK